jgi:two-component system, OmpR family, response regulator VicR
VARWLHRALAVMNPSTGTHNAQVLLVEDDAALATMVSESLHARGYNVWRANSAAEAEQTVGELRPDIIVLDLMLPDRNGLTLCSKFKACTKSPVIICSATRRKDDSVLGLQLGADDFVRKPFSIDELQARIDLALHRRSDPDSPGDDAGAVRQVGSLRVDNRRCEATSNGQTLKLTPTEFRLLSALAHRSPAVVSRHDMAESVWTSVDDAVFSTLDVHVRRLRAKLTPHTTGVRLVARRGFGYQLLGETA